jgi:hypothetical protein
MTDSRTNFLSGDTQHWGPPAGSTYRDLSTHWDGSETASSS